MTHISERVMALCCLLLLLWPSVARAESFTVVTNSIPPIKMVHRGAPAGINGDILTALMRRTGNAISRTEEMRLDLAMKVTATRPGTICLGLAKNLPRATKFKWIGPVHSLRIAIIGKVSSHLIVARLNDAQDLTLASVRGSASESLLFGTALPEDRFIRFDTSREAVQALADDTVDGVLMPLIATYKIIGDLNQNPDDYKTLISLNSIPIYFAFHPDTDDKVIEELTQEFYRMKNTDSKGHSDYQDIVSRYPKAFH